MLQATRIQLQAMQALMNHIRTAYLNDRNILSAETGFFNKLCHVLTYRARAGIFLLSSLKATIAQLSKSIEYRIYSF